MGRAKGKSLGTRLGKNTKLRDSVGGLERVHRGEKVIIRARERKEEKLTDLFKQTLKVMFHIITSL